MIIEKQEQLNNMLEQSKNILIVFRKKFDADNVSAALAMFQFLQDDNKIVDIVCDEFKKPNELGFLGDVEVIKNDLDGLNKYVLKIDLKNKKINEFSYDVKNNFLNINLLPKTGQIKEEDIELEKQKYKYDLIITIGTPDFESLGKVYEKNVNFFYSVPVINLDNVVYNDNYGQINLVDANKTSVAEIVYEIIKKSKGKKIDNKMATKILTGVLFMNKGFKNNGMSPEVLNVFAELLQAGAEKQKIIDNIFRTKTLAKMRLWGRAMARLQVDVQKSLAWMSVPMVDFVKTGAGVEDIKGVLEEMVMESPQVKNALLIYETDNKKIIGEFCVDEKYDAREILKNWDALGTKQAVYFEINDKNLIQVEKELVGEIKANI
jgi:nanoRNase/pAp phosphatase (c-di-AMP/oligoRNAs hydrolase)